MDRQTTQTANPRGVAQAKGPDQPTAANGQSSFAIAAPKIELPKGGGAIRGIGEKFAANPVTGTGSMSVPIFASPGRAGFGPQIALTYDSGAGNGPFGLGWNLSLPAITRKTDKGLPRYLDAAEPDVFLLAGSEDLVPVLKLSERGEWEPDAANHTLYSAHYRVRARYRVQLYRPRIEGLFARIEHWTNVDHPIDTFWRSMSRDNITTGYGRTAESRIFDANDPTRIFSWLICESHDDKGNVMVYGYEAEDSQGVDATALNELNRSQTTRSANRYLKRIRYGNAEPYFPTLLADAPTLPSTWLFELFDYGEHDAAVPRPNDRGTWSRRADPFSTHRAGFEIRTYRLCRRALMFHHFRDDLAVSVEMVDANGNHTEACVDTWAWSSPPPARAYRSSEARRA